MIVGSVGLGNMGSVLAANLVAAGFEVIAHDMAGPDRSPEGATFVGSLAEVAGAVDVAVLSLPDGTASRQVVEQLGHGVTYVVDTSTIGLDAARANAARLPGYVDAPVSGGPAGARARTLSLMYAGSDDACTAVEPVLQGLTDKRFCVGAEPGMAQALKLANNFLSATALAATSEAIAFGRSVGLDMEVMLEVLAASSGQNTAVTDKFPNHVVTGTYASGFANTLMAKDLRLYLDSVDAQGAGAAIGWSTVAVWNEFAELEPGVDFTRIYPFIEGRD